MSVESADLVAYIRAQDAGFTTVVAGAEARLTGLKGSAERTASAISKFGLAMGGIAVAGIVASVKAAMSWQSELSKVAANSTMTTADVNTMNAGILKMASDSSANINDMAEGFLRLSNFGYSAKDSMVILQQAMEAGVSTGAKVADVSNSLGAVMKAYGMSANMASAATNTLQEASAQGNLKMQAFADSAGKMLAMAGNLHVPLQDAAAAFAALTRNGVTAAQSSTMLTSEMTQIVRPSAAVTKQLQQLSAQTGIDLVRDFTQAGLASKGLYGVLGDVAVATQRTGTSVLKLTPNVRAGLAALVLTGNGTKDYNQILKSLNDTMSGRLQPVLMNYNRTQHTMADGLGVLWNKVQILAITIGTQLLPYLTQFVTWLISIVQKFADWIAKNALIQGAIKDLITWVKTLQTPLSNLLTWIDNNVITPFQSWIDKNPKVVQAIKDFATALAAIIAAGGAVKIIASVLALALGLLGPMGLAAIAVAAFYAAWQQNWGDIRGKLQAVDDVLKDIASELNKIPGMPFHWTDVGLMLALAGAITAVMLAMKALQGAQAAWAALKGLGGIIGIGGGGDKGTTGADKTMQALIDAINKDFPPLTTALTEVGQVIPRLTAAILGNASKKQEGLTTATQNLADAVNKHFDALKEEIATEFPLLTTAINKLTTALTGAPKKPPPPTTWPKYTFPKLIPLEFDDTPLIAALKNLTTAISDWKPVPGTGGTTTVTGISGLTSAITKYFPGLTDAIKNMPSKITDQVTGLSGLTAAITKDFPPLTLAVTTYFPALTTAINNMPGTFTVKGGPATGGKGTGGTVSVPGVGALTTAIDTYFPKLTSAITNWKAVAGSVTIAGVAALTTALGLLTTTLKTTINTTLQTLATAVNNLTAELKAWKPAAGRGGTTTIKGTETITLAGLSNLTAAITKDFPPLTAAITKYFPALTSAITKGLKISGSVTIGGVDLAGGADAILGKLFDFKGWLTKNAGKLGNDLLNGLKFLLGAINPAGFVGLTAGIAGKLFDFAGWLTGHGASLLTDIGHGLDSLAGQPLGLVRLPLAIFGKIFDVAGWLVGNGSGFVTAIGHGLDSLSVAAFKASAFIDNICNKIFDFAGWLTAHATSVATGAVSGLNMVGTKLGPLVKTFFSGVYGTGLAAISPTALETAMLNAFGVAVPAIINVASSLTDPRGLAHAVTSWVDGACSQVYKSLIAKGSGIEAKTLSAFSGASTWLTGMGSSIVSGLITGILNSPSAIKTMADNLKTLVYNAIAHAFGALSPATAMVPLGQNITAGIAQGILQSQSQLKTAVTTLTTAATSVRPAFAGVSSAPGYGLTAAGATGGTTGQAIQLQLYLDSQQVYQIMMQNMSTDQRMRPNLMTGRS